MIIADMKLIYAETTYQIRRALFNVYNQLGFGHKQDVYQKALAIELENMGILFQREATLHVLYNNKPIGTYRPDFVVDGKVILELKAVDFMPKTYETQLINYLKSTGFQLGLLINFGGPKLIIKRLVWANQRESVNKSV